MKKPLVILIYHRSQDNIILPFHCDIKVILVKPTSSITLEEKHHTCYLPKTLLLNIPIDDSKKDAIDEPFEIMVILQHLLTGDVKYVTTQRASITSSNWNSTHMILVNG
jgi:hypothetical protein